MSEAKDCGCKDVATMVAVYMDPVTVVLNLWASQRIHSLGGGTGFVAWAEVFPGVPLDEDGQVKPDPPDYRKEGGSPLGAVQRDGSDRLYEATADKYRAAPRWSWTALSACEVVDWALDRFTGDREYILSLLTKIHPNAGRFMLPNEKGDPFVAAARRFLDDGASARDAKDYARVMRSAYGAFRKVVWQAVGSETRQDALSRAYDASEYARHRRQINAQVGREVQAAQKNR